MELNFAASGCGETGSGQTRGLAQKFFKILFLAGSNFFRNNLLGDIDSFGNGLRSARPGS